MAPRPRPGTWSSAGPTITTSRQANPAEPWPTVTCCGSRPSPAAASWSAGCSAPTRLLASGAPPAGPSATPGYQTADLAYAITGHSAQGATVHTGIALLTGTEDRQWLYPAMTRGTDANLAYVFTTPPKAADPQPGTRAAPELDRYERIRHERAGLLPAQPAPGPCSAD